MPIVFSENLAPDSARVPVTRPRRRKRNNRFHGRAHAHAQIEASPEAYAWSAARREDSFAGMVQAESVLCSDVAVALAVLVSSTPLWQRQ